MTGYKVFRADWTAIHGYKKIQFKVGNIYEEDVKPRCACCGFHFCKQLIDCFNYYGLSAGNRIAEIEALGEVDEQDDKCCTNKIRIVREISWADICNYL